MQELFTRVPTIGGAFSSDSIRITFSGISGPGAIVQSVAWQYSRPIKKYFDLASNNIFILGQPAEGALEIAYLFGQSSTLLQMLQKFSDVCNIPQNSITLTSVAGCTNSIASAIGFTNVIITDYAGGISADNFTLIHKIKFAFNGLYVA